jgi:bla regulator protein blaR1
MKTFACALLLSSAAFASEDDAWVLVRDEKSVTMHGDTGDIAAARKFLKDGPGYLWFRRDGKSYVVRDEAVLKQVEEAAEPQRKLGALQAKLGRHQGELGKQQGELGAQQGALGAEQAWLAQRRAETARSRRGEGETEHEVAKTQEELGQSQEALGREQEKIGREQEKLGREQKRLALEMKRKVEQAIDAALKNGTAKRVD